MPSSIASPATVVRSSASADNVDLQLVEEIIHRASKDATTFPVVYQAYSDVLRSYGLDVPTDTVYYHFLLKLGVLKGRTWGERWDQWRADHPEAVERSLKQERSLLSTSTTSKLSLVKQRVPFLADADDVHETEEDDEEARTFLQNLDQHPTDTEASRSFVGYTPSHTDASFQPPERTSTPVYSRSRSRQASFHTKSPPLPPYTPSDTSHLSSKPHPPRTNFLPIRAPIPSPAKVKITRDEQVRVAEQVEAALLEMEGRAVLFYQTGLVGRCWEAWTRQTDWVLTTSAQVHQARNNILLRTCLHRWQELHQHQGALPAAADHHRSRQLLNSALSRWRLSLRQRRLSKAEKLFRNKTERKVLSNCFTRWVGAEQAARKKRWEAEMSFREATLVEKLDTQLLANTLTRWRSRHQTNKAIALHDLRAKQRVLHDWRYAAAQSQHLRATLQDYEDARDQHLVRFAFDRWRTRTAISQAHAVVRAKADMRRVNKALNIWRRRSGDVQNAKAFDRRRVTSLALAKWEDVTTAVKVLGGAAHRYRLQRDADLLRSTLSAWAAAERGRLLQRVRDTRALRIALKVWKDRQLQIAGLEAQTLFLRSKAETVVQRTALVKWRSSVRNKQDAQAKADNVRKLLLLRTTFSRWCKASTRNNRNEARAEVASVFFAQRSVMTAWKERLAQRRQAQWQEQKKLRDVQEIFNVWRGKAKISMDLRVKSDLMIAKRHKRIRAASLGQWTARIIAIKSRELDVADLRDGHLMRSAFDSWTQACVRRGESISLMHSFIDVKQDDALRNIFVNWHYLAVRAKDRRIRAEKREEERKERLVGNAFQKWRSVLRERALEPQSTAVVLRHEDALLFRVFDQWKARSHRLPAIAFESKRIKTLALKRWQEALPRRRQANAAAASERTRLMSESLRTWRSVFYARIAQRAAMRHRNVTKLSGITRFRPISSVEDYAASRSRVPSAKVSILSSTQSPSIPRRRLVSPTASDVHAIAIVTPTHARLRSELATSTCIAPSPAPSTAGRRGSDLFQELAGKVGSRSGRSPM